jgi:hypothetical protein
LSSVYPQTFVSISKTVQAVKGHEKKNKKRQAKYELEEDPPIKKIKAKVKQEAFQSKTSALLFTILPTRTSVYIIRNFSALSVRPRSQ